MLQHYCYIPFNSHALYFMNESDLFNHFRIHYESITTWWPHPKKKKSSSRPSFFSPSESLIAPSSLPASPSAPSFDFDSPPSTPVAFSFSSLQKKLFIAACEVHFSSMANFNKVKQHEWGNSKPEKDFWEQYLGVAFLTSTTDSSSIFSSWSAATSSSVPPSNFTTTKRCTKITLRSFLYRPTITPSFFSPHFMISIASSVASLLCITHISLI